jgi:hypothetical protein
MENKVEFAYIFKCSIKGFNENLVDEYWNVLEVLALMMHTWMRSRIPSSLSAPSTTKMK